jgi:O-antigen/teichoic acid export membrane protein
MFFASLLPPAVMGIRVLTKDSSLGNTTESFPAAWQQVKLQFFRSLPSVAAISVNNGVNWVCTIYLVQSVYGAAGVGVVAVAAQWLNLMLIPATSWGGVSLKALSDAIASGDEKTAWRASTGLMRKNLLVTLALAGLIAFASALIAQAYGLSDTDVALLICINAACALVASVNNIFERFLLALDRQSWWLFFSLASVAIQITLTWLFIVKGLWVVAGGVLVAGIALTILSYAGVHRSLPLRIKEQA